VQVVGSDASLDTSHGRIFGPFMRPIYGQVAYWPHGGRSLATRRRTTSPDASASERLSGDDYSGWLANHISKRKPGRAVIAQLSAKSRVRRCRSLTRRPESSAARLTSARSRLESRAPRRYCPARRQRGRRKCVR
jgi:hypothetical protein